MSEIAVITGGTSGIGRATALCLRDAGYDVYELSRREQGVEGLHHIRCDITDEIGRASCRERVYVLV